jgi:predicted amidophosphoribosyltransferase
MSAENWGQLEWLRKQNPDNPTCAEGCGKPVEFLGEICTECAFPPKRKRRKKHSDTLEHAGGR